MEKKSVYSLVLSDELVRAVDRLAYRSHTSRSNLINQILAEHLSLSTPEMRMKEILADLENYFGSSQALQLMMPPTDSQLSLRSSISYKYNPTVQYSVVLYRSPGDSFGELRVSFRTRNESLLNMLTAFFKIWVQTENRYLSNIFPANSISFEIQRGKFTRRLMHPVNADLNSRTALGDAAGQYIRLFDGMLKLYFENPAAAHTKIDRAYAEYMCSGAAII